MFVNMKKIVFIIYFLLGSASLFAQDNSLAHAAMKLDQFVKIPAINSKAPNTSFMLMREPVLAIDFQEFLTYLYGQNRIIDANICMPAVAKDLPFNTKYIILSNPAPIELYAAYLSERMSTKTKKVTYKLVTEKQWKQAKGIDNNYEVPKKNPFGLIFQQGVFEWKKMSNGNTETFTDINGYQRSSFRLVYTEKTIQTGKKK